MVRLLIARCTVDYQGRLNAHLPLATRLVMVKADGSVAVHADGGAYKPLNWMSPPCELRTGPDRWEVRNPKGELLIIALDDVVADTSYELGMDPGLTKDGVEAHLQELLAARPDVIAAGLRLVRREYPTDVGSIDLLCRDAGGQAVAVEVKRRGEIDGVEQLSRYLSRLDLDGRLRPVRGILVAQRIRPQAQVVAGARGITCVEVDYEALRGTAPEELTLF
jgi:endonuclease